MTDLCGCCNVRFKSFMDECSLEFKGRTRKLFLCNSCFQQVLRTFLGKEEKKVAETLPDSLIDLVVSDYTSFNREERFPFREELSRRLKEITTTALDRGWGSWETTVTDVQKPNEDCQRTTILLRRTG